MRGAGSRCWGAWRAGLLLALTALSAGAAMADRLDDHLNTLWEVLWDERGTPRRLAHWEGPVNFRVSGFDVKDNRPRAVEALREAAEATGLTLTDVTDAPDQPAQLEVMAVVDEEVPPNASCVTNARYKASWAMDKVTIRMRRKDGWRCIRHEVMHAMGLPGHPSGQTILSYMTARRDAYLDLDLLMLRAVYDPAMPQGATPLEAMAVFAEAAARNPQLGLDADTARQRVAAFMATSVDQLKALATGKGGVPAIVLRSGKASEPHMRNAAREAAYFLGLAYQRGTGVDKSDRLAAPWLQLGAEAGHSPSQVLWGRALAAGRGVPADPVAAYTWLAKAAKAGNKAGAPDMEKLERTLSAAQVEQARAAAAASPATVSQAEP